jgi:hypothetical protein
METRYTDQTGIIVSAQETYNVTLKRNEKCWGHFDTNDGMRMRHVGPWYKTKSELLVDHESYLIRAGWLKRNELLTNDVRNLAALDQVHHWEHALAVVNMAIADNPFCDELEQNRQQCLAELRKALKGYNQEE